MITYEADQQHADIIMRDYGLEPNKSKVRALVDTNWAACPNTRRMQGACTSYQASTQIFIKQHNADDYRL